MNDSLLLSSEVGIRINGDEFVEGGITTQESPDMARILEEAGAIAQQLKDLMDSNRLKMPLCIVHASVYGISSSVRARDVFPARLARSFVGCFR
jgi:hypothetical protein